MALDTYANLQASIASWVNRDDLTSVIPDFIALAESDMNATLRTRQNTAYATVTFAATGLAPLPDGFRAVKTIRLSDSPNYDLESVSLDRISELLAYNRESGNPEAFAVDGDSLRAYPTPSTDVDALCHYFRTIPALSDANTSNWVLTNYPQVYLYGAICHAHAYMDDTEEEQKFRAKFEDAMRRVNAEGQSLYGDSATMLMEATTP